MTAAIPIITKAGEDHIIADDFRSADLIFLYDSGKSEEKTIPLAALRESGGVVPFLREHRTDAVIAANLMPLAVSAFRSESIMCFAAEGRNLRLNISKFRCGELSAPGMNGARSGCSPAGCGDCSKNCGGDDHGTR